MANTIFVEQRINLYGAQSEQWNVDHQEAMACRDLEDLMRFGLTILTGLEQFNESQKRICVTDVSRTCALYELWYRKSVPLLSAASEIESRNYSVDAIEEFRAKVESIAVIIGQLQRIGQA